MQDNEIKNEFVSLKAKAVLGFDIIKPAEEILKNESAQIKGLWNAINTLERNQNLIVKYIDLIVANKGE